MKRILLLLMVSLIVASMLAVGAAGPAMASGGQLVHINNHQNANNNSGFVCQTAFCAPFLP